MCISYESANLWQWTIHIYSHHQQAIKSIRQKVHHMHDCSISRELREATCESPHARAAQRVFCQRRLSWPCLLVAYLSGPYSRLPAARPEKRPPAAETFSHRDRTRCSCGAPFVLPAPNNQPTKQPQEKYHAINASTQSDFTSHTAQHNAVDELPGRPDQSSPPHLA
jgi:hypothetical protein